MNKRVGSYEACRWGKCLKQNKICCMLIRELRVENEKKILHLMECNHLYSASETHFSKTMVRKYLDTKNCAGPSFFFVALGF